MTTETTPAPQATEPPAVVLFSRMVQWLEEQPEVASTVEDIGDGLAGFGMQDGTDISLAMSITGQYGLYRDPRAEATDQALRATPEADQTQE